MRPTAFLLLFLPLTVTAQDKPWKIDKLGVYGGYTHGFLNWNQSDFNPFKPVKGSSLSAYAEHYIGPGLSVRLGMAWQSRRMEMGSESGKDEAAYVYERLRSRHLGCDLTLKGYFTDRRHRPYLLLGGRGLHTLKQKFEGEYGPLAEPTYSLILNELDKWQFDLIAGIGFEFNNRWYIETEYALGLRPVFIWDEMEGYSRLISLRLGLNILKPGVSRSKDLGIRPMFE